MKTRFMLLTCIVTIIAAMLWLNRYSIPTPMPRIQLSSIPFPLTVGRNSLQVLLSNSDGTPVDAAEMQVFSTITQGGELTLSSYATSSANGSYNIPITYPRMGRWTVQVNVTLSNQPELLTEQFDVFVYPITPYVQSIQTTYRSKSELQAMTSANIAQELWIIIPPGVDEMMMEGLAGDLIPNEIYLEASGRNTLVIRNDDFANHNIGPFYIRAGETIRQQFTEPAVYEGTCSVSHSDEISIVVEA